MKCSIISGLLGLALSTSVMAATAWNGGAFVVNSGHDKTGAWSLHTANGAVDAEGIFNVTINTVGDDSWNTKDSGTFYHAGEVGDAEIIATIPAFRNNEGGCVNIGNYAKVGVMVRPTNFAYAPTVFFFRETTKTSGDKEISRFRFSTRSVENTNMADRKTKEDTLVADGDVRVRLVRRGDVFTGYYTTNTTVKGWTEFYKFTMPKGVYSDGALYGVTATPQNSDSQSNVINVRFTDVVLRRLVETENATDGIRASWSTDIVCAPEEYPNGFKLYRKNLSTGEDYSEIATGLADNVSTFLDTTAVAGEAYKYKVVAMVEGPNCEPYEYEVGESSLARIPLQTTNPNPGVRGYTLEYVQNNDVVGCYYYSTSLYNPWNAKWNSNPDANRLFPDEADDNLSSMDNFKINLNSMYRPTSSGYYQFQTYADDGANIYVNGQLVSEKTRYTSHGGRTISSPVYMEAGKSYDVKMFYTETSGGESLDINMRKDGASSSFNFGGNFEPVPMPWTFQEKGYSPILGNTIYTQENKSFTQFGSGLGFDGIVDEGQFASMKIDGGDFDFTVRLNLSTLASAGSAGIVLRADEYSDSAEQLSIIYEIGKINIYKRSEANTAAVLIGSVDVSPDYSYVRLAIARRGNMLSCYFGNGNAAASEKEWLLIGSATEATLGLASEAYVGLVTYSGNHEALTSAVFDRISAIPYSQVKTSLAMRKGTENNSVITVSEDSPIVNRARRAENIVGYFWSDYCSSTIGSVGITYYETMNSTGGVVVSTDAPVNSAVTFDSGVTDPRALQFYEVTPLGTATGLPINDTLTSMKAKHGVAFEKPTEEGKGLFMAVYRTYESGPETELPNHFDLTDLSSFTNGRFTTQSGKNVWDGWAYHMTVSGYLCVPYSGEYVFRGKAKRTLRLAVDGADLLGTDLQSLNMEYMVSRPIYLEAGKKIPIFCAYFHHYNDKTNDVFEVSWKNGAGVNGDFTPIPRTAMFSDMDVEVVDGADVRNNVVAPGLHDNFGDWKDIQFGNNTISSTYVHGDVSKIATKPEIFNVLMMGCSSDNRGFASNGADELGHYMYREVTRDFSIEANISSVSGYVNRPRAGFVVRKSLEQGSESIALLRDRENNNVYSLGRLEANTAYVGGAGVTNYEGDSMRIKVERVGDVVNTYVDDVLQESYNIRSWGKSIYVGLAASSGSIAHKTMTFFSNINFTGSYDKTTLIVIY